MIEAAHVALSGAVGALATAAAVTAYIRCVAVPRACARVSVDDLIEVPTVEVLPGIGDVREYLDATWDSGPASPVCGRCGWRIGPDESVVFVTVRAARVGGLPGVEHGLWHAECPRYLRLAESA